jgi:tetratricopeptide (TPR) repeat protein
MAAARRADTERQAGEALDRAESLRAQARIDNDAAKWAEARALAERAAAAGEDLPTGHELSGRVRALVDDLAADERDRRLVAQLEEAWLSRAEVDAQSSGFALRRSLRAYPPTFAEHGLRVADAPADAAAWVRRRPPQTREALIAGLDAWLGLAQQLKAEEAAWLFGVLQAADADEWRKDLRRALQHDDAMEVERLARSDALARQPPQTVLLLTDYFRPRDQDRAIELLRQVQGRFPADFWINFALADAIYQKHFTAFSESAQFEDAVRFFTAALALRPDNLQAQTLVGWSLWLRGRRAEGRAVLDQLRSRRPDYFGAHLHIGAMSLLGELDKEEERAFREAIRLNPRSGMGHMGLGFVLWQNGRYDEALLELRQANRLDPFPRSYLAEGGLLMCMGRLDEAVAVYRRALQFQPDLAEAKSALQFAQLTDVNRLEELLALTRAAAVLWPNKPEPHVALNRAFCLNYKWEEALAAGHRAEKLKGGLFPVRVMNRFVSETEQLRDLQPCLPEYVRGERAIRDPQELLVVFCLCWFKQRYRDAAQIYTRVLADPKLTGDVTAERRYDAARYAAMTAAGLGDAAKLDGAERDRWRKQAVAWLRADLAGWDKWLVAHPGDRALVRERLAWWQQDPKLAGLRDPAALAKLLPVEQTDCRELWSAVAALSAKAARE